MAKCEVRFHFAGRFPVVGRRRREHDSSVEQLAQDLPAQCRVAAEHVAPIPTVARGSIFPRYADRFCQPPRPSSLQFRVQAGAHRAVASVNEAVLAASGWPADSTDGFILRALASSNAARAVEPAPAQPHFADSRSS